MLKKKSPFFKASKANAMLRLAKYILSGVGVLCVMHSSHIAQARPGFNFDFNIGYNAIAGEQEILGSQRMNGISYQDAFGQELPLTTNQGSGLMLMLRTGFNALGYAALELDLEATAGSLDNVTDNWVLEGFGGVRLFPLWHWQKLLPAAIQDLEPSIFFGSALVYHGYKPVDDAVAWRKSGAFKWGLGVDYFISSSMRVGLDYAMTYAAYDVFIYNYEKGFRHDVSPPAKTFHHQVFVSLGFTIDPFEQPSFQMMPSKPTTPQPQPAPAPSPEVAPIEPEEVDI
jgi:hypothetical protein